MTLGFVIAILLIGLLLIFLEIFFIPGTTLFGIAGGVALVIGIIMMYAYFGKIYGNVTLGVSLVAVIVCIVLGFRVIESNKLSMKAEITGKVNELSVPHLNIGDSGKTVTELRPNGKAVFNGIRTEVYSQGDYVPRDSVVEVIKITHNKVFVKPLKS